MTKTEMALCQCVAELMSGTEPDWSALGVPIEIRTDIVERAKRFRADRDRPQQ